MSGFVRRPKLWIHSSAIENNWIIQNNKKVCLIIWTQLAATWFPTLLTTALVKQALGTFWSRSNELTLDKIARGVKLEHPIYPSYSLWSISALRLIEWRYATPCLALCRTLIGAMLHLDWRYWANEKIGAVLEHVCQLRSCYRRKLSKGMTPTTVQK